MRLTPCLRVRLLPGSSLGPCVGEGGSCDPCSPFWKGTGPRRLPQVPPPYPPIGDQNSTREFPGEDSDHWTMITSQFEIFLSSQKEMLTLVTMPPSSTQPQVTPRPPPSSTQLLCWHFPWCSLGLASWVVSTSPSLSLAGCSGLSQHPPPWLPLENSLGPWQDLGPPSVPGASPAD